MSFLSFAKKEEEISLLIDIGSGTITVALVLFSRNAVPEFLCCIKNTFPVVDRLDSAKLTNSMFTLLDSMMNSVIQQKIYQTYLLDKGESIERVLISFSTPWYIVKPKHIHIKEEKPFLVTRSFLEDISHKEERAFKKELSLETKDETLDNFSVIEKSIIHTKINGYVLDQSVGKKATVFDVSMYLSAIAKKLEQKVLHSVQRHTHLAKEKIVLHTFPLILFSTIRDNFAETQDFLIMDITGEVTDISLVKDDIIVANASFPFGRNSIIKHIARAFRTTPEVALSTLHMYMSKKTDGLTSRKVEDVIMHIEKEWSIYFEDTLHSVAPQLQLPKDLFVTVDSDVAPLFVDFIHLNKTDSTSTFRKKVAVSLVNKEFLSGFYSTNSKIDLDEFIVILADFYNQTLRKQ